MEEIKVTREIDIIYATKTVLKERKLLISAIIIGTITGLIIALSSPKSYTAEVVLAPEISSGGLGLAANLSDMASSFGFDLGKTSNNINALYPEIYPEIIFSNDFIQTLFTVPIRLKDDDKERTYYDHLLKDMKVPFWTYPKIWLTNLLKSKDSIVNNKEDKSDRFKISKKDAEMSEAISGNIGCLVDKKTSIITITVTDQDPLVAAIIADTLQLRLQDYITQYRTKKARLDFDYYTKLHNEAKAKYQKAQKIYATFCDANKDVTLETYIAKRDELENNMQTAFNFMNQMALQMQAAKAKIQERTPAYIVLKSPKMPYKASSMSRIMIIILTIFVAVTIDFVWVLFIRSIFRKRECNKNCQLV